MKLKELIAASRSFRSFDRSVPLSREQLTSFVECARLSPSSRNLQALKFRFVLQSKECEAVLSHTKWAGLLPDLQIPPEHHEPTAYIVICFDCTLFEHPAAFARDVGICAQSIMLAATEAGFGGCMIGSFSASGIRETLQLPEHLSPQLILALGKPDEAVELTDLAPDGSVAYYRENGVHFVPKRSLEELIL